MPSLTRSKTKSSVLTAGGFTVFDDSLSKNNQNDDKSYLPNKKKKIKNSKSDNNNAIKENKENNVKRTTLNNNNNNNILFNGNSSNSNAGLKKTINISEDERKMTGAPVGELFNCKLLEDDEILPSSKPLQDIHKYMNDHMKATLWVDKFAAVEGFRQIALYHSELILDNNNNSSSSSSSSSDGVGIGTLAYMLEASIEAVGSIRSSISRNGIKCIEAIYNNTSSNSSSSESTSMLLTYLNEVVLSLLNRIGTGPKFIANIATIVLENIIRKCPIMQYTINNHNNTIESIDSIDTTDNVISNNALDATMACIEACAGGVHHKNALVAGKAFELIASRSMDVFHHHANYSSSQVEFSRILELLCEGQQTKSIEGKLACRRALNTMKSSSSSSSSSSSGFRELLNRSLQDDHKVSLIMRMLESKSKSSSSSSSSSSRSISRCVSRWSDSDGNGDDDGVMKVRTKKRYRIIEGEGQKKEKTSSSSSSSFRDTIKRLRYEAKKKGKPQQQQQQQQQQKEMGVVTEKRSESIDYSNITSSSSESKSHLS